MAVVMKVLALWKIIVGLKRKREFAVEEKGLRTLRWEVDREQLNHSHTELLLLLYS